MALAARPIHFAGCNASQSNSRTLFAPDRAIAIPHAGGCAKEGLASRDRLGKQEGEDHSALIAPMIPTTKAPPTNAVSTQYSIAKARCFHRGSSGSGQVILIIRQNFGM